MYYGIFLFLNGRRMCCRLSKKMLCNVADESRVQTVKQSRKKLPLLFLAVTSKNHCQLHPCMNTLETLKIAQKKSQE